MPTKADTRYTPWTELRRLRLNAGYSKTALAAAVPMSRSQLSHIECGRRGLSDDMLIKLARALDVQPAELDRTRPKVPPVRRNASKAARRVVAA